MNSHSKSGDITAASLSLVAQPDAVSSASVVSEEKRKSPAKKSPAELLAGLGVDESGLQRSDLFDGPSSPLSPARTVSEAKRNLFEEKEPALVDPVLAGDPVTQERATLKQILLERKNIIDRLDAALVEARARMAAHKPKALLGRAGAVSEAEDKFLAQELELKLQASQIEAMIRAERAELDRVSREYTASLDLLAAQVAAQKANLLKLKKGLAEAICAEIRSQYALVLKKEYFKERAIREFAKQYNSFVAILPDGKLDISLNLLRHFDQFDLQGIQFYVQGLLSQTNSTETFGKSDALKRQIAKLEALVTQPQYQALAGAQGAMRPFKNGDIRFNWQASALDLEKAASDAGIQDRIAQLRNQHLANSGIGKLQAAAQKLKSGVSEYALAGSAYNGRLQAGLLTPETTDLAQKLEQLNQLNRDNPHIAFPNVTPEQGRQVFDGVNRLGANLVRLKKEGAHSPKDKQLLFSPEGTALHVSAAEASYALLDAAQRIRGAYPGKPLPGAVSSQLTYAFGAQSRLVRSLTDVQRLVDVSADGEVKLNFSPQFNFVEPTVARVKADEVKREMPQAPFLEASKGLLADLTAQLGQIEAAAEDVEAMQLASMVRDTVKNHSYWKDELFTSRGGEAIHLDRGDVRVPTGIKGANDIVDRFDRMHPGWTQNPDLARQFLTHVKSEANLRLQDKIFGLFSRRRKPHNSEFLQFMAGLELDQLSKAVATAKTLHCVAGLIEKQQKAESEERSMASMLFSIRPV